MVVKVAAFPLLGFFEKKNKRANSVKKRMRKRKAFLAKDDKVLLAPPIREKKMYRRYLGSLILLMFDRNN